MRRARPILRKAAPIVALLALALVAALVARDAAAVQRAFDRSDLVYRRALRAFAVDARRAENPYDFSRPAFRAEAQATLGSAERSELAAPLRSKAAMLQGVLTFEESIADPVNGSNLVRAALGDFTRAIRIDPSNEEAKYNLEFLLRLMDPRAARLRIRENIPTYRPGRSAPGGAPPRRGHGY